jgi:hypothetical protein
MQATPECCRHLRGSTEENQEREGFKPFDINNSVALDRERATPTERPQLVSEVSAYFCGQPFDNSFNKFWCTLLSDGMY